MEIQQQREPHCQHNNPQWQGILLKDQDIYSLMWAIEEKPCFKVRLDCKWKNLI